MSLKSSSYEQSAPLDMLSTPNSVRSPLQIPRPAEIANQSQPISHAHKIWLWPALRDTLTTSGIEVVQGIGFLQCNEVGWLAWLQKQIWPECGSDNEVLRSPGQGAQKSDGVEKDSLYFGLTFEEMQHFSNFYFNTFNYLYPLLDRKSFFSRTLVKFIREGVDCGITDSVVTLLVLALGELAFDGSFGEPVAREDGKPSGLRGGSAKRPPGLSLFNEARKKMGFVATQYELENVQIFSLAAYVMHPF